ncbi:MAG: hydroxyacylglutathione hydrolase [Halioglobus sp.]|nr:hydroxyacylglutathione hydrolase [Halioglobus sp.]
MLEIHPVAAFSDNYIWLFHSAGGTEAAVVDPGDAEPVLQALDKLGLTLTTVLITHHHFDHVGGLEALCAACDPVVYGPHNPGVAAITHRLAAGDTIEVFGASFDVLEVPGHTLDHIAYFHDAAEPVLFCGDTLFAGGCGRVFEGDPPMMLRSLDSLAALPAATRVYCAHEYTLANLAFARAVEPDNAALLARIADAEQTRERGQPTVPSDLALELATNPFLRCREAALKASLSKQGRLGGDSPEEVFATVRGWKDNF